MQDNLIELPLGKGRVPSRRNSAFLVGILTVAVAAAVFFCELHLSAAPTEQTAITALVMLLCCFVMYSSLYDAGHAHAAEREEYRKIIDDYESLRERVRALGRPSSLERFCSRYVEEELYESRSRLLLYAGVDMELFLAWQGTEMSGSEFDALPKEKKKALRAAGRLKPLKLSAFRLLSGTVGARRKLLLSTRPRRIWRTTAALIPTMMGCLITVGVSVEGVTMTPALLALGLLRIFAIVWTGVRGYAAGVSAVSEDDSTALGHKITLLRAYLASNDANAITA